MGFNSGLKGLSCFNKRHGVDKTLVSQLQTCKWFGRPRVVDFQHLLLHACTFQRRWPRVGSTEGTAVGGVDALITLTLVTHSQRRVLADSGMKAIAQPQWLLAANSHFMSRLQKLYDW